jgi:hypothetical protein
MSMPVQDVPGTTPSGNLQNNVRGTIVLCCVSYSTDFRDIFYYSTAGTIVLRELLINGVGMVQCTPAPLHIYTYTMGLPDSTRTVLSCPNLVQYRYNCTVPGSSIKIHFIIIHPKVISRSLRSLCLVCRGER